MPRYRKLHVKTLESLDVNEMPNDFTRLFWVLLPLALCREGRGLANASWLKSRLFPLREDVSQEQVRTAFAWCVDRAMVELYTVDGRDYFHVPTFHLYQGVTIKETESNYPPPPFQADSGVSQDLLQTNSRPTPELVQSKSSTDTHTNTDTTTDSDADTTATTDASAADAVQVMEGHGMTNPREVLKETNLTPAQLVSTVKYAEQNDLGAGWVRDQARKNQAHALPRPPPSYLCPTCHVHPCMCEKIEVET